MKMAEQGKKISFGFSKVVKKTNILPSVLPKENNVQFIECLEGNSIKIIGGENDTKEKQLVIPMKNDNSLKENIITAVQSRSSSKNQNDDNISENNGEPSVKDSNNEGKPDEIKPMTLDELAAKEILEDLKKENKEENKIYAVPLPDKTVDGETESTLEDYDNIPVSQFGLAMLRGMGWQPSAGIGKNNKVIKPPSPILRPKGMGLGADKVIQQNQATDESDKVLPMAKGSSVKIIAGEHKNLYGKIEGFDEIPGRMVVKLTIASTLISVSEFMVRVVSNEEYNKNSNVLNISKFDEYKLKETKECESLDRNLTTDEIKRNDQSSNETVSKTISKSGKNEKIDEQNAEVKEKSSSVSKKESHRRKKSRSRSPSSRRSHTNRYKDVSKYNLYSKSNRHKSRKKHSSNSSESSEESSSERRTKSHSKYEKSSKEYKRSSSKHKKHKKRRHRSRSRS